MAPKVSVVIPCYNHGAYLEEAVASVLQQSFDDFEIVVVDDGSTDPGTVRLLERFDRPKTRVIRTANAGVASARNTGIRSARGRYILPLDADDRIGAGYLEKAAALLDARAGVGVVYCEQQMFGARSGIPEIPPYDPVALLFDNLIFSGAMYRKCDWERVGGYSPRFVYGWEDWDFWIALSTLGKEVVRIPEPLYFYRILSESRDRSMRVHHKIAMMALLIARHRRLYLRHLDRLASSVAKVLTRNLKRPSSASAPDTERGGEPKKGR